MFLLYQSIRVGFLGSKARRARVRGSRHFWTRDTNGQGFFHVKHI
jgi:hypothetical protein